jgi:hypothetical protein
MTLKEWMESYGKGALTELHFQTRLAYNTIKAAEQGTPVSYKSAKLISKATSGRVSIISLLDPDDDYPRPDDTGAL